MQKNSLPTNIYEIKRAAKEGKICEALGHVWDGHVHSPKDDKPGTTGCRHCKLCDLHQYRYMKEEWK